TTLFRSVSAIRRKGRIESRTSEQIEETCRKTAHVLGTILNGHQLTKGEKPASVLAQHRTATAIYKDSHVAPPLDPHGRPEVVLVPEPARTADSLQSVFKANNGRIAAHVATWCTAISVNRDLPKPGFA